MELRFTIMFDEFDKTFGGVFPSPIGELHFSIIIRLFKTIKTERFRPLSGSYISQLRQEREENLGKWHVSVPYRGATFLNGMGGLYPAVYAFVSVPYRGATFLNVGVTCYPDPTTGFRPLSGSYISQFIQILHMSMSWGSRFPSPIGELHFSISLLRSERSCL